jgi:2-(1,2-epoxy-1,2-dihydrophenyl)acetyl-CoA isomerase
MTTDLLENVKDGVAVLTLNRPERLNAMSRPMLDALLEALPRLADDAAVGVIVLTGAGRGFCAGGDVKAMAEGNELGGQTMEEKAQALRSRMEASRWLHELPKPTIAMMRGPAAGAGLSLAMACDMRIASDTARLGTAFARVGYSGDFGGSYWAPRRRASCTSPRTCWMRRRPSASGSSIASCPTRGSRRRPWRWPRGWPAGRAWPIAT